MKKRIPVMIVIEHAAPPATVFGFGFAEKVDGRLELRTNDVEAVKLAKAILASVRFTAAVKKGAP